ncbi:MAG: peptide chain release factor aRF-1 [Candidatus Micrarchaeota archaeon]
MAAQSKEAYEFRRQVEALKQFRGRGTELISVYITPGYAISDVTAKLRDEYGQASNIKSKTTQLNVQAALQKVMQYLKTLGHRPPENGIAIFCGNLSESEGKTDIRLYSVVPPTPMQTQFYRCDSAFVTDPLEELMGQADGFGLVVMDGKEATVALLKGKTTKILKKLHTTAHQKVMKGGQSAARYDRLHTEGVEYYYKRIGEAMESYVGMKNFKGVIVGGPGPAKEGFLRMKPFHHELKIIAIVDTGYTDEQGLRELIEKSEGVISEQEAVKEKKLVEEFMKAISTGGLATYGLAEIREALESGKASKLLVAEGLELHELQTQCAQCGSADRHITEEPTAQAEVKLKCGKCGARPKVTEDKDIVAGLQEIAAARGIDVELVSQETHEGQQFLGTFHGLGAFLRYR